MQEWFHNAICYHIYPIGFCGAPRENQGGAPVCRLDSVIELIPHFKQLSVDAVYFGPVFESVAHGYDTTDYYTIDRRLGTNESFKKICDALHENGIRVILDGVFNHVGREFPQFVDVREKGQSSPYCDWFANLNFGGGSPCGDPFWYEAWNGCYNLVKLNLRNPAVCDHILGAVGYWMDEFKIDGLRLDAADCIDFDFFRRLRGFCKSRRPDFWLMGEIIHGDYKRWANNEMLDAVTNYECYKGIYSSHNDRNYYEIDYSLNRQFGNGGIYKGLSLYNFVDNHDVNRLASSLRDKADLQNCYTLLYTMPGIPSIYYGGEFGAEGRKEGGNDDPLRPAYESVSHPGEDCPLMQHLTKLGRIYRAYPALHGGDHNTVIIRNQQMLYLRECGDQKVYVALNLADEPYEFQFGTPLGALVDVLSAQSIRVENGTAYANVPPHTGMILVSDDIVNHAPEPQEPPVQMQQPELVIGGRYRHFKGGEYIVIALARHSETLEEMVVYRSAEDESAVWVRPKTMFSERKDGKPRFELLA